MANKTFVSNSTLTISDSNTEALGSTITGQEIVKIRPGVTGAQLDANFERIDLSGTLASYKFVVVSGTGLQIQNVTNSAVVATIPNINQNVKIAFTDGSATLAQAGGTVFTLNGTALAVGATSASATVSLTGSNVLNQAAGETSTVATTLVTTLATNATPFTGSIADSDMLDVGIFALTSAAILNGGTGGLGSANTIAVKDGANISSGAITYFTDLLFDATSLSGTNDLTMTAAQHAGFTGVITAAGTGTSGEKITLTTIATGLSLFPVVENYVLGNFVNSVTQTAVGQAITGAADVDTVTAITGVTSTSDLLAGANVVIVPNAANISAGTFSATGGTVGYNVDSAATGTLTLAQQALISSASGTQSLTLSAVTTAAATLNANVETFTLATSAGNSATLGANAQNIVLGGSSADTISVAGLVPTGYISGLAAADTLVLATGADIKGLKTASSGSSGGATGAALATVSGLVTMTNAQHAPLTITASGSTDQITINDSGSGNVTAAAQIEKYVVNGTSNVTVNAATSVTGDDAGNQTVTVAGLTATGTYALGNGTDVITATTGASIAGVNAGAVTTAETLSMAGTVTMTNAQYAGFATFTAGGSSDQITISDTNGGNLTAVASIEKYVTTGTSNVTVIAATNVDGDTGNQTVTVAGLTATGTYALGNGTDVITATTGASIAGVNAGAVTTAETLSFAGTTTLTAAQLGGFATLTGTTTPILTVTGTSPVTATTLDSTVITTTATRINLPNVASNAITAKNASLANGIVLEINGSGLTGTNQLTFSRGDEVDGKFSIVGGAGADVFTYTSTAQLATGNAIIDTIDGGAGTSDELKLTAATGTTLTIATGDSLANITNVEKITAGSSAGVISITRPATTNIAFTTIDLSGDTDATGTNVISSTGANAITTIIGSAGVDQITLGVAAPATTITGGAGADTLSNSTVNQVTISDVDGITITMGAVANTTTVMTGALLATVITGGSGVDAITLAGSVSNVATITGAAGADVLDLGATHTGSVKIAYASTTAANLLVEAGSAGGANGTTAPAATTVDTVTNFISGTDKIALKVGLVDLSTGTTGSTAYSTGNQTLNAGDFVSGIIIGATSTALVADTANKARFYFDTTSKVLYFDASGDTAINTSGAYTAGAVDDFAVIKTTGTNLVASDFFFVA